MTYIFLSLSLLLFIFPFLFAFDKAVFKVENIGSLIIPSILVAFIFSEIAVFFTGLNIWVFHPVNLIGVFYRGLPLEYYLFVLSFNFAGLSVYTYLNAKFSVANWQKYALFVSNLLFGIFIAILYFSFPFWFPTLTCALLFLLLIYIEYGTEFRFMGSFYRMFVVMLFPFFVCYAVICNLPIITYSLSKTIGFSVANIPFENMMYVMVMLLTSVFVQEHLKKRLKR